VADELLCDVTERVAVITMNRPDQRNALNAAIRTGLPKLIRDLDGSDDVDVMVLTGADPAFSAGVDLKEVAAGGVGDPARTPWRGPWGPHDKPLIGAVNGVAVTGGFEYALNCDFLIASERARFADTHARVGVMPGWGLTVLLPQRIGVARAREMSLTGNYIDAQTALAWGLVNHVVPHEELMPFTVQLARDIVSNDQAGVRRMLQTYAEESLVTTGEAWDIEDRVSRAWEGPGFDPTSIAERREQVTARGRSQIGT